MFDLISVLGSAASIGGLVAAGFQTVRLRELRRRRNVDVWLAIRTTVSIIRYIEGSPALKSDHEIGPAFGKACDLFRQLLKEAILVESGFDESTIVKWRRVGKIDSDWQEAQARHFLDTGAISDPPGGCP